MFVSPRFRDIFASGPVKTRRTDNPASEARAGSTGETDRAAHAEAIWLDITAAHRRAARVFTPEFIRTDDLAGDR